VVPPSRRTFSKSDDGERRGGRNHTPSAALLHHATGRDRGIRTTTPGRRADSSVPRDVPAGSHSRADHAVRPEVWQSPAGRDARVWPDRARHARARGRSPVPAGRAGVKRSARRPTRVTAPVAARRGADEREDVTRLLGAGAVGTALIRKRRAARGSQRSEQATCRARRQRGPPRRSDVRPIQAV
jgi:hypothetical protein